MGSLGLGTSLRHDPAEAAAEAADLALEALGEPRASGALVVSTAAYGGDEAARRLCARACRTLGTGEVLGAGLDGVMAGAEEWTAEPAVAVMAFGGDHTAQVALLDGVAGHEAELAEDLVAELGGSSQRPGDLVLFLADPHGLDGRAVAASLDGLSGCALAGIAAGESFGPPQPVWAGDEVASGAIAALRVSAGVDAATRISLTQAGRPIAEPLRITRVQGHWILALEGRPALEVYRDALPLPLRNDLPRAARSVLVAFEEASHPESGPPPRGPRVRNVIGFDEARAAFSVAEAPKPGDRLALVALDGVAAREELRRLAARLSGPTPAGGLYLNCRERARALFDHEGYELGEISRLVGGAPMLGLMGSHIYGRSGLRHPLELQTYAAIAALIDR